MRIFRLLGIQSPMYRNPMVQNWGDYPEGEAIYQLSRAKATLSESALKEAKFKPSIKCWSGHPVGYFKE